MASLGIWLEMEIDITGGEEDGVDITGVDSAALYTQARRCVGCLYRTEPDQSQL